MIRAGEAAADEWVYVLDSAGRVLDSQPTDRDGLASFELPAGDVLVAVWDASTTATVAALGTAEVELEIEDAIP